MSINILLLGMVIGDSENASNTSFIRDSSIIISSVILFTWHYPFPHLIYILTKGCAVDINSVKARNYLVYNMKAK